MMKKQSLAARKEPQQARSRQMREDILDASVRVLQKEGPLRFTTPRVADAAGVSVGSLYQYFPNKRALLFALHERVIRKSWDEVRRILEHPRWPVAEKIRRVAIHYFRNEASDTKEMGPGLRDIEIHCAGQPQQRALEQEVLRRFTALAGSRFGAELLFTVLESVGRSVADRALTPRQRDRWARATADMVTSFVLADASPKGARGQNGRPARGKAVEAPHGPRGPRERGRGVLRGAQKPR